jgi:three-Cys-motif partner protein
MPLQLVIRWLAEIVMLNYLTSESDGLPMRPSGGWAEQKLDYLARYIDVFETSMKSKWPTRNYVDLMAGPGKNQIRGTNKVFLGSPLLALATKHPFTRYFFVDLDPNNTDALRSRCAVSIYSQRVRIETGDCNQLVDRIVTELKQNERLSLNLAFLDPEGFELQWTTVAKLASIKRMDLIINYPEGGLNRYMRIAYASPEQTDVDRFFGERQWRKIYENWISRRSRIGLHRLLIDHYKTKLKDLGYTQVFAGSDAIDNEPLMRNTKSAPLYRLLFASKHDRGYEFWQKVIRRDVYGRTRLPGF